MIWHNKHSAESFSKLQSLEVRNCQQLMTVLPSNVHGMLLNMENLSVNHCRSLRLICDQSDINSEAYDNTTIKGKEVPVNFFFPKLTYLQLHDLPEIKMFYPGKHKVEAPILKEICLRDCGSYGFDESGQIQQPFHLLQKVYRISF